MNWLFLKEMSSKLKNLYWCYSKSYSLKVFLLWWGWLWLRERGVLLDYEWFLSLLMSLRGLFPQCSPSSSGSPSGVYLHPHNQPRRLLFICLSPFSPISSLSILHPFFPAALRLLDNLPGWRRCVMGEEKRKKMRVKLNLTHVFLDQPALRGESNFIIPFQLWDWFQPLVKSPKLP